MLASLTSWLGEPASNRALIVEDGSTGSVSPLARWLESVGAAGSYEVISASIGPAAGLVLERDILVALYGELYPEDRDEPAAFSLAELRDHVRAGLRAPPPPKTRLVALDRVGWGERSFRQNLGGLLGRLGREQKLVVSVRVEDGDDPDVAGWCERLGWRVEETLCLHLPAGLDGKLSPLERARQWVDACIALEGGGGRIAAVLDVLAIALRPLRAAELSAILDLEPRVVDVSLGLAPKGAVAIDPRGGYAFDDPCVARAWARARKEATGRVHKRIRGLGKAALRGEARPVVPYVIEHFGARIAEHGGAAAQIALVSEAWRKVWSSSGNLLGFEADVARVWSAAERELLANASAPAEQRAEPILTMFRCVQVSMAAMCRVRGLGSTVAACASALVGLAEELPEPQRTWAREGAADVLLGNDTGVGEAALLVRLVKWFEGERRDAIVARALAGYRAEVADWANSVWLLHAVPLLSAADRQALCAVVIGELHELPDYDAATLRETLKALPSDLVQQLTQAIPALAAPDRSRFQCALAPYLDGNIRGRIVDEVLDTVETSPSSLGRGDVRALAPVLDAAQLARLGRALQRGHHGDDLLGICLRALCALGHAGAARSLAGAELAAMPFDWVLALAAGGGEPRVELREEVAKRLSAMDASWLGWTIARDVAELVRVVGVDFLLPLARAIPADEERIVARVALVPFVAEAEKRALVGEAVRAFFAPTGQEGFHWQQLLSCWEQMSAPDACRLLAHASYDHDVLPALADLAPLLRHLAGGDGPSRIAEQIIDVGRWMPSTRR